MQTCIAAFNSMTQAIHAQRILAGAAIHASVIKLDAQQSSRGCAYGIAFSCAQMRSVRTIFTEKNIFPRQIIGG